MPLPLTNSTIENPLNILTNKSYSTVDYFSNNQEVLRDLAENEQIVEWVTLMVDFHK